MRQAQKIDVLNGENTQEERCVHILKLIKLIANIGCEKNSKKQCCNSFSLC